MTARKTITSPHTLTPPINFFGVTAARSTLARLQYRQQCACATAPALPVPQALNHNYVVVGATDNRPLKLLPPVQHAPNALPFPKTRRQPAGYAPD